MAKIVVLAGGDDVDAVTTALEGASLDFEIVEPTAANLLHIVIGMVDDEPEDEPEEPKEPKEKKAPKEPTDAPPEDMPADDEIAADASAVPESMGGVYIDGYLVEAVKGTGDQSILMVASFEGGAKTSYAINESQYSFYPADQKKPTRRLDVIRDKAESSVEVRIAESKDGKITLIVGKDLESLFAK